MSEKPAVGISVAVAALVVAGIVVAIGGGDGRKSTSLSAREKLWFYDLGSKELFAGPAKERPPVKATSGEDGVRAYVFSCGQCSESEQFIGYLENFEDVTPKPGENAMIASNRGHLIRAVDGTEWFPAISEDANKITGSAKSRCSGDQKLTECFPESN